MSSNMSPRPEVSLSVPPGLASLDTWGQDAGGNWWALVLWDVRVSPVDADQHPHTVRCAAWVPGVAVSQTLPPISYLHIARIRLPAEPAHWPAPISRPGAVWQPEEGSYYVGVLFDGEQPQLPAEAGIPWGETMGSLYG